MQKIEASIRPNRLEQVRQALEGANITGISVTDIDGFGDLKGRADQMFRGQEYTVAFRRIVKLEFAMTIVSKISSKPSQVLPEPAN